MAKTQSFRRITKADVAEVMTYAGDKLARECAIATGFEILEATDARRPFTYPCFRRSGLVGPPSIHRRKAELVKPWRPDAVPYDAEEFEELTQNRFGRYRHAQALERVQAVSMPGCSRSTVRARASLLVWRVYGPKREA